MIGFAPRGSDLLSSRMVGRGDAQSWMERRIARCLNGSGTEMLIEGAAGIGKTRLLHELGLQAQPKGLTVLRADAEASATAYGVAIQLASALLAAHPDAAAKLSLPEAGLLSRLSPELRDALGSPRATEIARNPAERRVRFQTVLYEWFAKVARERALLVCVDNLHAADHDSAAFLSAIGNEARKSRLMLIASQRTGADVVAPIPVQVLRKRSTHFKLSGLDEADCGELVESLFGDVEGGARVARLLYEKSAGNPQHCLALAQWLVTKQIARHMDGAWVLPFDVSEDELPNRVEELTPQRLETLSDAARALAEVISLHDTPLPIELCLALSETGSEAQTYAALDQLVAEQVLRIENGRCRFEQTSVREGVLARIPDARRKARHRRAAGVLLGAAGSNIRLQIEGAFHLMRAGEELRGARLLAVAGRNFLNGRDNDASAEQVTLALNTALQIYERHGRSEREIAGLLLPLMALAVHGSWPLIMQHGERALELGLEVTGLGLAQRLRPLLGAKLALGVGLGYGALRFVRERRGARGLDYGPWEALVMFCACAPPILATSLACADAPAIDRMRRSLLPLTMFGEDQLPSFLYGFASKQGLLAQGRQGEVLTGPQTPRWLQRPKIRAAFGEDPFRTASGELLWTKAVLATRCFGDAALDQAREAEALEMRSCVMAADQVRLFYHAYRGEAEQARYYRARVELFALQGNTTWHFEMSSLPLFLEVHMLTADTIGTRRVHEQYSRLAREVASFEPYVDASRAAYLTLRGQHDEAIALFERVTARLEPLRSQAWAPIHACFAAALCEGGQYQRAKQRMLDVLARMTAEDRAISADWLVLQRQLAAAEAGLGNVGRAVEILDALLRQHGSETNALFVGLLHKSRAEVALCMNDRPAFERHFDAMELRFRSTRHAALVAQVERLGERAVRAGLRDAADHAASSALGEAALAREVSSADPRTVHEISAAADPFDYALKLILQRARARTGYLFQYEERSMRLVAATAATEPHAQLLARLEDEAAHARLESPDDSLMQTGFQAQRSLRPRARPSVRVRRDSGGIVRDDEQATSPLPNGEVPETNTETDMEPATQEDSARPRERSDSQHVVLLLQTRHDDAMLVTGGIIIEAEPHHATRLARGFLEAIAEAIHRRS